MIKSRFEETVVICKVEALVRMELNLELEILVCTRDRNAERTHEPYKLDALDKLNYVRDALDNLRQDCV